MDPSPETSVGRIPIVGVSPALEEGRWPARAVVGEAVPITATIFREGHDSEGATVVITRPDGRRERLPMPLDDWGTSTYRAPWIPRREGLHTFRVEAWSDPVATWAHAAEVKIHAGVDVQLMLDEGVNVLTRALTEVRRAPAKQAVLQSAIDALRDGSVNPEARLQPALSPELKAILTAAPLRDSVSTSREYPILIQREKALVSAWYEIFPRSEGARRNKRTGEWHSGTFTTAAKRLPAIAAMGFDVVYLTPIHPIGITHRKGRNNSLKAEPGDPGSPYAIGAAEGGHDAIHPELGTMRTFKAFVKKARETGLEVALDVALQCSPDHPWVTEHPEWFTQRLDGTIAYAENPPKKYQDIYPLNFDNDPEGIYHAIRDMLQVWIDAGVTLFRVDNPHTKPLTFWERLLREIAQDHPEVIFLSEAFTRPAMMHTLAKIGFHQSYTYFTWRQNAAELGEYLEEVSGDASFYMRPNFWPTTHDILTPDMQHGGPALYRARAVLAATGAPSYGIYTGYEFVENVPRPGVEEQIDNEKYEFKARDWDDADRYGIQTLLTRLNDARRRHVALRRLRGLTLHRTTNPEFLCFTRHVPAEESPSGKADTVIVIASLDPHHVQSGVVTLDMAALGLEDDARIVVDDELTGATYTWGRDFYVRLDPAVTMAHVAAVRP
ncbi:alpha-1,4-glucan--maltose-1-phosphate maltosyltransferase [Demequina lignilytica]|uniref:Alpha-1,4-glucan:maltose-1-phosphate maltosyltransferase n=1 Tax=Demequina lignilytica TaxID=3051663 RepID=A0AAW7M381_9MICO|nr:MULTISPECIES: alpha-1,4-glucan--maltose-1-phosphate maltosyltransferase [unclassified Demequina]MDN4479103.1 alpha-1,4-glucan--maltose-1-phosphate maltosyltransferase [Demequina sp. SYSU T00039-1]MDN4482541.1 alpha-1,4-glucan--maltose-1-phosphate maltosyltransferase [Demequina sp. SYSU T0a273]MDN4489184.1 alpha-1,4-glucan--maltose-1-phosphate maltosyltransferase [Demequina sp. SYSU T00039]MDN4490287.1 alpha-1,4-glucan--maltose-1-phosphate maltosyltransferase [Demequina sp. SYSU T00068]